MKDVYKGNELDYLAYDDPKPFNQKKGKHVKGSKDVPQKKKQSKSYKPKYK